MIVVEDSSPLIALATCSSLDLLPRLYEEVYVPESVFVEVTQTGKAYASELAGFSENKVVNADLEKFVIAGDRLGRGELEAMALYKSLEADHLLIDDQYARRIAEANQIYCVGALRILLEAKKQGLIGEVAPYLKKLKLSPIYYSDALLEAIANLADEKI